MNEVNESNISQNSGETYVVNNDSDNFMSLNERGKKKHWPVIAILLLVLLLGFGAYYYSGIAHNSKTLFSKYVSKLYEVTLDSIDEVNDNTLDIDLNKDILNLESSVNLKTDVKMDELDLSKLNDYTFNSNILLSLKDEKMYSNLGIDNKGNDFFDIEFLLNKSELLLSSKEIFDKVVKIPLEEEFSFDLSELEEMKVLNLDDIKYIVNFHKEYTLEFLDKLEYEGSSEKVNDQSVYKSTVTIDANVLKEYYEGFINKIINDSKMLEILNKLDVSKEDVQTDLDYVKEAKVENNFQIVLNLYTNHITCGFVKLEVVLDRETLLTVTNVKKLYTISLLGQEMTYDDNSKTFNYSVEGIKFEIVFKEDRVDFNIKYNEEYNLEIGGSLSVTNDKKLYKTDLHLNVKTNILGQNNTFELTMNNKLSKASSFKNIEGTVINYEELGNYIEGIVTKVENKFDGTIFEDLINVLSNSDPDYYEDNYYEEDYMY